MAFMLKPTNLNDASDIANNGESLGYRGVLIRFHPVKVYEPVAGKLFASSSREVRKFNPGCMFRYEHTL